MNIPQDLKVRETDDPNLFSVNDPSAILSMLSSSADQLVPPQNSQREINTVSGYVVKTRLISSNKKAIIQAGQKMFINIVHSPYCPSPPIIENDELEAILAGSAEPGNYKVPMSLSPVRNDTDKAGNACLVVDACVNSGVYEKSLKDKRFQEFIIELALAWVEQKNDVELGREWSIPKMKHKGELVNHLVYRTKDVVISEVEQTEKKEEKFGDATGKSGVDKFELDEFARALPRPVLKLQKVKKNGIVNKLVIKFYLSLVESAKECTVDIEKNRVLFLARNKYFAEIDLPNEIDTELGNATFDVTQQCLELVLHCLN